MDPKDQNNSTGGEATTTPGGTPDPSAAGSGITTPGESATLDEKEVALTDGGESQGGGEDGETNDFVTELGAITTPGEQDSLDEKEVALTDGGESQGGGEDGETNDFVTELGAITTPGEQDSLDEKPVELTDLEEQDKSGEEGGGGWVTELGAITTPGEQASLDEKPVDLTDLEEQDNSEEGGDRTWQDSLGGITTPGEMDDIDHQVEVMDSEDPEHENQGKLDWETTFDSITTPGEADSLDEKPVTTQELGKDIYDPNEGKEAGDSTGPGGITTPGEMGETSDPGGITTQGEMEEGEDSHGKTTPGDDGDIDKKRDKNKGKIDAASAASINSEYPGVAFRFNVEVDGIIAAHFTEASGMEWEMSPTSFHEGGLNFHERTLMEPAKFTPLTLKRGFTPVGSEFYLWMKSCFEDRTFKRRNVSVIVMNQQGAEVGRMNFKNAFIQKFTGPTFDSTNNAVAFEQVQLKYDYFEYEPASKSDVESAVAKGISSGLK